MFTSVRSPWRNQGNLRDWVRAGEGRWRGEESIKILILKRGEMSGKGRSFYLWDFSLQMEGLMKRAAKNLIPRPSPARSRTLLFSFLSLPPSCLSVFFCFNRLIFARGEILMAPIVSGRMAAMHRPLPLQWHDHTKLILTFITCHMSLVWVSVSNQQVMRPILFKNMEYSIEYAFE